MKRILLSIALVSLILSSVKSQQKGVDSYFNANHSTSQQRQNQRMVLPPNQSVHQIKSELSKETWQDNLKEYNPYYSQTKEWTNTEINFYPTTKPMPVGDINNDGFDDFVTYNGEQANELTAEMDDKCYKSILFYGNNTGGFTTKLEYKKIFPAGDINNDGYADLFFQEYEKNTELHFGSTNGFVKADISFEANLYKLNYSDIDLNRDGFKDCVFYDFNGRFQILFGHSDPQKIEVTYVIDAEGYGYDINLIKGDTKSYLLFAHYNEISSIEIKPNKSLVIQNEQYDDYQFFEIVYVDVDNNGSKELLAFERYDKCILFKNYIPGGNLTGLETLIIDEQIRCIGDLNSDDIPEFAHFCDTPELVNISVGLEVKLNTVCTTESVIDKLDYSRNLNNTSQFLLADYNNDNKKELVAFESSDSKYTYKAFGIENQTLSVYNKIEFDRTNFEGAFPDKTCNLGDINGDGLDDIALYNNYKIDVYTNGDTKTPVFSIESNIETNRIMKISAADMNSDGYSDWIVGYWDPENSENSKIEIYYGGTKLLETPVKELYVNKMFNLDSDIPVPEFGLNFIGSVDGDKYPELIMFNTSYRDRHKVFIFKGGENFPDQPTNSIGFATNFGDENINNETFGYVGSSAVSLGDINNDGINDFVLADTHRNGVDFLKLIDGCLFVFYGKADLNFTKPANILYNQQYNINFYSQYGFHLTAGDYNGDGMKDIAVAGYRFNDNSYNPTVGVDIFYRRDDLKDNASGPAFNDIPNRRLFVKAKNLKTGAFENLKRFGGLTTVPDLNGDHTEELIMTVVKRGYATAYLYTGSKEDGIQEDAKPIGIINSLSSLSLAKTANWYYSRFPFFIAKFSQSAIPEFVTVSSDLNYLGNSVSFYRITDPLNLAPKDILFTGEIKENSPVNTLVGELSVVDENSVDYHIYQLVADDSGNTFNNDLFEINENKIAAKQSFDFETHPTYQINVKVTDASNASFTKLITIKVLNVNEAPTALTLSKNIIEESTTIGTVVGTVSAIEVDKGDMLTYSIVENENFKMKSDQLLTKSALDYEKQDAYSIKLIATDVAGLKIEKEFEIRILDVNEAPTALTLSNSVVPESSTIGTEVGIVSGTDVDKGDVLTYIIEENDNFEIKADQLLTKSTFDYENRDLYSIKLTATDANGLKVAKVFSIRISDVNEAPVFKSEPITSIGQNLKYVYEVKCFDIDGDDLTVEAIELPNWLTLSDSNNGSYILSGTPEVIGDYDIVLSLSDGEYTIKQEFKIVLDYILGVEEVSTKQSVNIYPNPVVNDLYIDLSNINSDKITINLFTLAGNQIFKETHQNNMGSLKIQKSVQDLKAGMYLLLIESDQGKKGYKIIKR